MLAAMPAIVQAPEDAFLLLFGTDFEWELLQLVQQLNAPLLQVD